LPLATRSSSDVTGDPGGCHRQRNEVMRCDAWRRWTWPWASRPMDFLISIRLSTRARKRHAAYRYADAGEEGSSGGSAYAAADDGGRAAREAAAKDGWFAPSRGRGVRLLIDTRFRSLSSPRPQASGGQGHLLRSDLHWVWVDAAYGRAISTGLAIYVSSFLFQFFLLVCYCAIG